MWKSVVESLLLVSGAHFSGQLILKSFTTPIPPWVRGFVAMTLGILIFYTLWILLQSIEINRYCLIAFGATGLANCYWNRDEGRERLILILISALFTPLFLKSPISGWDADSIWYFHAKMIHFSRGFPFFESLSRPEVAFSHPAYPKLFAYLSALSSVATPWNDYTPKLGFLLLLSPLFLLFLKLPLPISRKLGLILVSFLGMKSAPFTCLPEYSLALWCATGTVLLVYSPQAAAAGWLALGFASGIKAEGTLYFVSAVAASLTFSLLRSKRPIALKECLKTISMAGIAFVPTLVWLIVAKIRITSPLGEGFLSSWSERVSQRLLEGRPAWDILSSYFQSDRFFWEMLAACALLPSLRSRNLLIPIGYFFALFLVYLSTPYPLSWHLITSVDRTLLPGIASCFFILYFRIFFNRFPMK